MNLPNYSKFVEDLATDPDVDVNSLRDFLSAFLQPASSVCDPVPKLPRSEPFALRLNIVLKTLRSTSLGPGTIFSDYLNLVQESISPSSYLSFLHSLSLYISSRMSHEGFIRLANSLFLRDLPRCPQLIRLFSPFLAAVNSASPTDSPISIGPDHNRQVHQFIIQTLSYIVQHRTRDSFAKCLAVFGDGLIPQEIAAAWLTRLGVRPSDLKLFRQITDGSLFHPGRLPRSLFPFPVPQSPGTAAQQFALRGYRDVMMEDLAPAALEILCLPLRSLRRLLKRLVEGETLSEGDLVEIYGSSGAREFAAKGAAAATILMDRLSRCYGRAHARYTGALRRAMARFVAGDPQFRIWYKVLLKVPTFCGPFLYPGTRAVDCHSPSAVKCALALIREFAGIYFRQGTRDKLTASLAVLAEIFVEGEDSYFIVDDPHLKAALYLAEVARLLGESGNTRRVLVAEKGANARFAENQQTEFGEKLRELPSKLADGACESMGGSLAVVDIPLVRCLRFLKLYEGGAIVKFPDTVEDYSLFSTLHQVREGSGLTIVCSTNFSPTPDEEDDGR
jgi:hypothetical protein